MRTDPVDDPEIELLLDDLMEVHGYDFSDYSKASFKRRVNRLFTLDNFPSFAEFRFRLRTDEQFAERFVEEVTVNVTEMFRDPGFFVALREQVLPHLATYPLIRIWHAGCSTGEEVYSMAILLKEEGILHKSILYGTDLSPGVISRARTGMFDLSLMKANSENYIKAGGKTDFSTYYTARYNNAVFDPSLGNKMVFATHNLVSDRSFNHFQLILCRNVLIYFQRDLQDRVFNLLNDSLEPLGFLGLGSRETIRFAKVAGNFEPINTKHKIWRKVK